MDCEALESGSVIGGCEAVKDSPVGKVCLVGFEKLDLLTGYFEIKGLVKRVGENLGFRSRHRICVRCCAKLFHE